MEFRLLGPLEVAEDGRLISLGGSRGRALLALLLLHRNEVVTVDRIVDELWSEQPPRTAGQAVRVYVSQLRKALEPARSDGPPQVLLTQGNGYVLKVERADVDIDRFDDLRVEGRRLLEAGDAAQAADVLGEALSLWRGPPFQDFAYEAFARTEIARLEELRVTTLEDRFDAQLATGRDSELVADLEQLVDAHPLRERLRAQLMLALYRSGRQADALETYRRGRRLLADELGLEPSEALRRLESRILQPDPELELPEMSRVAPPNHRRPGVLGLVAAILVVAAIAGALIAATGGRGQPQPGTAPLRVAFVQSGERTPTSSFLAGVDPIDGLRRAARQLGVHARVFYGGNRENGFLRTIAAAARKYDFVIVGATPNPKAVSGVTRRFPETRFFVADSIHDPAAAFAGQRNVTGEDFDDRENGYLGGYLAGLMTHGHQAVSAVGGFRTGAVDDLIHGYAAGARRARPGVRVLVDYTGTFDDQSACEAAANRQIDHGSAVVFDVAGSCGFGAMQAAAIRRVWGLGVDSDLSYLGPQIVASVVKRFDRATAVAVNLFASGQLPGGRDLRFDLSNNGIGLVGINDRVPPAVRAKVEALAAKLRARDQMRGGR